MTEDVEFCINGGPIEVLSGDWIERGYTALGYSRGNLIVWNARTETWHYMDTLELTTESERPCPKCGEVADGHDAPDPCLGWVDGFIGMCCGHGVHDAYAAPQTLIALAPPTDSERNTAPGEGS